jgi:hypothetical protein
MKFSFIRINLNHFVFLLRAGPGGEAGKGSGRFERPGAEGAAGRGGAQRSRHPAHRQAEGKREEGSQVLRAHVSR